MVKLQFEFTVIAASDGKSNLFAITSITTEEGKRYAIPEEKQAMSHHEELKKTTHYAKIKNSMKKRYQKKYG